MKNAFLGVRKKERKKKDRKKRVKGRIDRQKGRRED